MSQNVGANIRALRRGQHLTVNGLVEKLDAAGANLDRFVIYKVEKGERNLSVDDLDVFARAFGVAPAQLLGTFECQHCHGAPPAGYACTICGTRLPRTTTPSAADTAVET